MIQAAIYSRIDPSPMRLNTGTTTRAMTISASASTNWIYSLDNSQSGISVSAFQRMRIALRRLHLERIQDD